MKTELLYLVDVTAPSRPLVVLTSLTDRHPGPHYRGRISDNPPAQSAWARRLMKAHTNNVENLVVFAALVLAAAALGKSNSAIATAAMVYFWARVVHVLAYTFAVPWVRTLAFAVGFFAQAAIAWQILAK
jgi:uncharacterized MAPEG superfamily protein